MWVVNWTARHDLNSVYWAVKLQLGHSRDTCKRSLYAVCLIKKKNKKKKHKNKHRLDCEFAQTGPCMRKVGIPTVSRSVSKRTFGHVLQAKILISLRMCAGWPESSLGAFWIVSGAKVLHADNEDFYQILRMRRLIWVNVWSTCQMEHFLTLRLKCIALNSYQLLKLSTRLI